MFDKVKKLPKESTIKVSEDFNQRTRQARRLLYPRLKQAKEQGKRAFLRGDKLYIDDDTLTVNFENQIVSVHK